MERFFRKVKRNVRKRAVRTVTEWFLFTYEKRMTTFQNTGASDYVNWVFGSDKVDSKFARDIERLRKDTVSRMMVFVYEIGGRSSRKR